MLLKFFHYFPVYTNIQKSKIKYQEKTKVGNICFFSPLVLSNERILSFLSLYIFWGKCVHVSIFELCQTKRNCEFHHSKRPFSSKSILTEKAENLSVRELAFSVCIFLRKMCLSLIFEWWHSQSSFVFCAFYHSKIEKCTHFLQKVYKLRKLRIPSFDRTRREKKQIFPTFVMMEKDGVKCVWSSLLIYIKVWVMLLYMFSVVGSWVIHFLLMSRNNEFLSFISFFSAWEKYGD